MNIEADSMMAKGEVEGEEEDDEEDEDEDGVH